MFEDVSEREALVVCKINSCRDVEAKWCRIRKWTPVLDRG